MTAPDLSQRLTEIKERLRTATAGPWIVTETYGRYPENVPSANIQPDWDDRYEHRIATAVRLCEAPFIAHAREDVPFLLEQLAAQSLALEEAQRQLTSETLRANINADEAGEHLLRALAADTQRAEARQQIAQLQTRLNEKWDAADAHVTKLEDRLAVLREALTTKIALFKEMQATSEDASDKACRAGNHEDSDRRDTEAATLQVVIADLAALVSATD